MYINDGVPAKIPSLGIKDKIMGIGKDQSSQEVEEHDESDDLTEIEDIPVSEIDDSVEEQINDAFLQEIFYRL